MQHKRYNQSWLLWVHVILGGVFIAYTIFLVINYDRNIMEGRAISIFIALLYLFILNRSTKLFNRQEVGGAYFLTITGFLGGVFVQAITCANSIYFH